MDLQWLEEDEKEEGKEEEVFGEEERTSERVSVCERERSGLGRGESARARGER